MLDVRGDDEVKHGNVPNVKHIYVSHEPLPESIPTACRTWFDIDAIASASITEAIKALTESLMASWTRNNADKD